MVSEARPTSGEVASPAELGERSHEAITGMVINLLATPEFMAALGRTFFGRSFAHGGRAIIADGVNFTKGESTYSVSYRAEPLRFGPQEVQDYNSSINLTIFKFSGIAKKWPETNKVSELYLSASFVEDQEGHIKGFTTGAALILEEFKQVPPRVGPEPTKIYSGSEALDKMPQSFSDLHTSVEL